MAVVPNAFCVVDKATGHQLMLVVDDEGVVNPTDPAWNPPGAAHIAVSVDIIVNGTIKQLDDHIIQRGADQGITVKTQFPPTTRPMTAQEIVTAKAVAAQAAIDNPEPANITAMKLALAKGQVT